MGVDKNLIGDFNPMKEKERSVPTNYKVVLFLKIRFVSGGSSKSNHLLIQRRTGYAN